MAQTIQYDIQQCQFNCIDTDYIDAGYWNEVPYITTAITPVDVYGALGFDGKSDYGLNTDRYCELIAFCDGPIADGLTLNEQWERFETRWIAVYDNGRFFYSRTDGILADAPAELFPDAIWDVNSISISFDGNARPCFGWDDIYGWIELRRFQAGTPVTYRWQGRYPRLFYNGIVQFDLEQRDIVCYYMVGNDLCARFQRENFAVEYTLIPLTDRFIPQHTDRGRGLAASYHFIDGNNPQRSRVGYSVDYPPWPVVNTDYGLSSVALNGGSYFLVTVEAGTYQDQSQSVISLSGGSYFLTRVDIQPQQEYSESSISVFGGSYFLTIIDTGSYTDESTSSISLNGGVHFLAIVDAGTYTDYSTSTISTVGGTYAAV